jgi:tRNA-splicing ligase RtcB (3'-phosphate/5'-hydroxy nucleic acid ligase)
MNDEIKTTHPAPYREWGDLADETSIQQMQNACSLPISVKGALMPDAHSGYGLPIGGVLATKDAVIPYAVGMDIACRMCMTVVDWPVTALEDREDALRNALVRETQFGVGARYQGSQKLEHPVMDDQWDDTPFLTHLKDKAWSQLGTSGSGNHFAEFGELTLEKDDLGLKAGRYLALLSHSGSRGTGADIAQHYSKLAARLHPELPPQLTSLAWLMLDSEEGRQYWHAMELMGRYASANHELIHRRIVDNLGIESLLKVENHHNFAWREEHDGQEVVVHRKGATPAGSGALGIIPGSMATPGYVVRGLGNADSMDSAAHGAGRRMSRKAAKKEFTWEQGREFLDRKNVNLISAGLDEVPMAYKDIEAVMDAQVDLVTKIARFDPRLVRMCKGR